jgi:hypothetical protein
MKRTALAFGGFLSCVLSAAPSQAAVLSVSGGGQIISAPTSVVNSSKSGGYANDLMSGFNEQQNLFLTQNLAVDSIVNGKVEKTKFSTAGTSFISAGKKINSHMIFLNQKDGQTGTIKAESIWTFDGKILGVMSDLNGSLLSASDSLLGAAGTTYGQAFSNRGMETGDTYSVLSPSELKVNMNITQPGDWIRVITEASDLSSTPVPEPTTLVTLFAVGALGLRQRKLA